MPPVTRTHQVVHGDLVLHVLGELGVDVREGVSRVGGLGGGGARRVGVCLALDGGEVGEEGEGVLVALLCLGLHTDGDLLERGLLLGTGLGVRSHHHYWQTIRPVLTLHLLL